VVVSAAILAGCGTAAPQPTSTAATAAAPLPTLDPDQVARGRQIYVENCASCHGPSAEGALNWQQPDDRGNLPPPPHDDSGHTWRHPDAQLDEIIRDGQRDPFNKTPELTMPPFRDRLSDEEIADVIAYFKSLWSEEYRRFQEEQNQRPPIQTPGTAG
jgi:mono/diheme cytochrome c family protein